MDSEHQKWREPKKCFIPTCPNDDLKNPGMLFFNIRKGLKERWCHLVNRNCPKRDLYCCEAHINAEEDIENYMQWISGVRKPKLKLDAVLKNISENVSSANNPEKSYPATEQNEDIHEVDLVCRVCLAMDVKMYDLNDIEMREMFQNITGIAVTENNHPILQRLCWECAGRLKAAAAFRNKALLSDALLQGLANTGEQIQKHDITLIKDSEDYLKTVATLTVVEAFHTVDIDPENDGMRPVFENNDTKIVQNIVRKVFLKQINESIIDEDNDQTDVEDESMIEAPVKTEMEYDQFDHICPNTGEESSNVFVETNHLFISKIPLKEDTIDSANSSLQPTRSHVEPKYPVLGYRLKTPSDCEEKVKKHVIKIKKIDSISKIVSKNSKELISAKSKNMNVKIGGISKKTSNLKLLKNTLVQANRTDVESREFGKL